MQLMDHYGGTSGALRALRGPDRRHRLLPSLNLVCAATKVSVCLYYRSYCIIDVRPLLLCQHVFHKGKGSSMIYPPGISSAGEPSFSGSGIAGHVEAVSCSLTFNWQSLRPCIMPSYGGSVHRAAVKLYVRFVDQKTIASDTFA